MLQLDLDFTHPRDVVISSVSFDSEHTYRRRKWVDENGSYAYHTGPTFSGKSVKVHEVAPWEELPCSPIPPSKHC